MAREKLSIDFDGVIKDLRSDNPMPNVASALRMLGKKYELIVFTARADTGFVKMWIKNRLNLNMRVTNVKEHSLAYIDDHAERFTGNWIEIVNKYI